MKAEAFTTAEAIAIHAAAYRQRRIAVDTPPAGRPPAPPAADAAQAAAAASAFYRRCH